MPRLVQSGAFFALMGVVLTTIPGVDGAERLGVLVTGTIVSVAVAYVLPWVFDLHTEPVIPGDR